MMLGLKRHAEAFGEETRDGHPRPRRPPRISRARSASTSSRSHDVLARLRAAPHRVDRRGRGRAIVVADVRAPAWSSWSSSRCRRSSAGRAEPRGAYASSAATAARPPKHRTSAFVVDDRIAIDAGSLTSGMELEGPVRARGVPREPRAPRSHPRSRDDRRQPLPERLRAARHRRHEADDRAS